MKRNYKFFLFLVGSLTVSLNTLFLSLPAASEEAQILPPQVLPTCPEKLPILEADRTPTETIPVVTTDSSSTGLDTAVPPTVPKTNPISTAVVPLEESKTEQSPKTNPAPKVSHSLKPTPLSVPAVEPPTSSHASSLVKPSYKSLPLAPPVPTRERPAQPQPLAKSAIPVSPSLPPVADTSSSVSTAEIPHMRYLSTPIPPSANSATSGTAETKATGLESDLPVSTVSNLQATIGCTPVLQTDSVVDGAQTSVLPETPKTESPTVSPDNNEIEKSIEHSERSLKGLRPF